METLEILAKKLQTNNYINAVRAVTTSNTSFVRSVLMMTTIVVLNTLKDMNETDLKVICREIMAITIYEECDNQEQKI